MDNKNSKSESYVVKEAENIIENYLRDREMSDIKNYYQLQEKYNRLKILTVAIIVAYNIGIILNIILN